MQIYCKRTLFKTDEKSILCKKGKFYNTIPASEFEFNYGIIFWTETEIDDNYPLTQKSFEKFFWSIDEMRHNKINEVLK